MVYHNCVGLHIVVVGINMIVGTIIFNIVIGLGFVGCLGCGFVMMLLVGITQG